MSASGTATNVAQREAEVQRGEVQHDCAEVPAPGKIDQNTMAHVNLGPVLVYI